MSDEIIKRLRAEIESLKKEMKMLYDRLGDCAIRETKLTLEVKVLRDALSDVTKEMADRAYDSLKGTDAGS